MINANRLLQNLLEETLDVFRRAGFLAETIFYPEKKRSIDIVGVRDKQRIIAKITTDTIHLSYIELSDLKKASKAYEAFPIIISHLHKKKRLEPDIVVKKKGLNIVSVELLEDYLLKHEKPLVFETQGTYLVKINPTRFREKRLEKGYSIGQLARELGVSRKAVYDYEHGNSNVSIDIAIKIADILGENVFEPIDIFEDYSKEEYMDREPRDKLGEILMRLCQSKGIEFYSLFKTPIDYVLKHQKLSYSIVRHDENERNFDKKIQEAYRITRTMNTIELIIRDIRDLNNIKKYVLNNS